MGDEGWNVYVGREFLRELFIALAESTQGFCVRAIGRLDDGSKLSIRVWEGSVIPILVPYTFDTDGTTS